jgi:hypothetical protein
LNKSTNICEGNYQFGFHWFGYIVKKTHKTPLFKIVKQGTTGITISVLGFGFQYFETDIFR